MARTVSQDSGASRDVYVYCTLDRGKKTEVKSGRYLVIGWEANDKGILQCELPDDHEILRGLPASQSLSGCEPKSLFACGLVPTLDSKPGTGKDMTARILRSLLACLKKPVDDQTLRIASNVLSSVQANWFPSSEETIEGAETDRWSKTNVVPDVAKLTPVSPLSELRIKGILAAWDAPGGKIKLLRRLPTLLPELQKVDATRSDLMDDYSFLSMVHLFKGLDPDEAFDLCSKNGMWAMLLDNDLAAPSKDNQRKLLGWLSQSPSPDQRAFALNMLAHWNEVPDKTTGARWSPEAQVEIVLNEAELMRYWQEKIGRPIRP